MPVAQLEVSKNREVVKIMRKNPLNKGIIMENAAGIGTVTSEMVEARARELAAINGRPSSEPSETDFRQAKRELTGEAEIDPQEESTQLFEEGVSEAEHDQMRQASRADEKSDEPEP
jgi:DNA-binding LacI/PurR family transcriptional regulator